MNKVLKSLMVSLLMVMSGMAFASGEHWITDPGQYSENAIFVGIITVDGNEQRSDYLEIGAFCNDECRGSVLCTYEPDFDRYLAYLTVNGEDGMVMNLKIWDHTTGTQLRVNRDARFTFVADDIKGSPDNPYTFAFTTAYDFSSDGLRYRINDDGETVTVVGPDSESFEKGFPTGWSQIDADGDGYGWAIWGENTHSGSSCVSSASWVNDVGPLYPDNYLVSPLLSLKGNMAFYVCAQDASYAAEHFGVAVSTGSQTNPADFSMLAEWTLSAKGGSQSNGPRGSRDAGSWYEYSIDLSSYEGQNGYVAIRHFNCTDQFYILVDDICFGNDELEIPEMISCVGESFVVTAIGDNAFSGCSYYNGDLTIPNSVTSIGSNAFNNCTGFNGTLTIGESVSSIGNRAFWNTNFTTMNYNAINCETLVQFDDWYWSNMSVFYDMHSLTTLYIGENVQVIPEYAFSDFNFFTGNLTIPNSVTTIGNNAFNGCSGFNGSLTIGNSVTSIGDNAFNGCSGFNGGLTIPNSVTYIGYRAFYDCNGFSGDLTIPNSVTSIGNYAFNNCTGFNGDLTIGDAVASLGYNVFYNTNFTTLNYNAINVDYLNDNKWRGMYSLTNLNIGENVQIIPSNAFYDMPSLTGSLVIPNSVTVIGDEAFANCSGFNGTLTIPNSVTYIGYLAFAYCYGFTGHLVIPNSVTFIGSGAFESCEGIETLTLGSSVESMGCYVFAYSGIQTLYYNAINCEFTEGSYEPPFEHIPLATLHIADDVQVIPNYAFRNLENLSGNLVFSDAVTFIGDNAFEGCMSLSGLTIGNSVETIGNSAFKNCYGIENLVMGNSVQTIGDYAFQNCGGIGGELTLPESLSSVGLYAFASCDELNTINYNAINCTAMGNANEPVFYDCVSLEHINIGENVECIPNYAFKRCSTVTDMSVAALVPPTISNNTFGTVSHSIPVEVPCGTAHDYEVATYWSAFNNYLQNMNYTLEVAPDDPENGTVVVNKEADCDDLYAEIQAYPELGHVFAGWNEGGEIVSTDNPYSLLMDENHNLQAVFEEGLSYSVSAAALPAVAGVVRGMGNYNAGVSVTMSAMPYQGYDFVNWTENGEVVSTEPEFSFTIEANRQLVANFTSNAYHWEVDEHQFESNMTVIGVIQIEGVEQRSVTLELGAFADDVCRGRQMLTYYPQVDRYLVFITLHGNADDVFNFRLYDHETEMESTLSCLNTMTFQANGMVGTPMEPFVFGFVNRQNAEMAEGWNWFSTYIEQEGIDGLAMLEASLANNGVMVKAQEGGFVMNDAGIWLGNLNAICNEKTYLINTSAACEAQITGPNAVPAAHPLIVNANWSWIGYPSAVAVDINEAMADFTPTDGDMIKALDCFSTYYTGMGWFGSLHTLMPGSGYMYYSYNEDPVTLTYAMGTRETLQENLTAENNHWQPNTHAYPYNMSVMAVVELDGMLLANEDYELAAFSGNECRGSVELTYVEPIDSFIAFLPVAGEEETTVSLALYNRNTGMMYQNADGFLHFEPNAVVGCLKEPYVARFSTMDQTDEFDGCVKMYPNPVASGNHFEIDMPFDTEVKVEIINALGMVVSVESSVGPKASFKVPETPGVYMVKIMAEGKGTCNRKLVVE